MERKHLSSCMIFWFREKHEDGKITLAMAGFSLKNTLSENGAVTRGVCVADETGYLVKVIETTGIQKIDGKIRCDNAEVEGWIHQTRWFR